MATPITTIQAATEAVARLRETLLGGPAAEASSAIKGPRLGPGAAEKAPRARGHVRRRKKHRPNVGARLKTPAAAHKRAKLQVTLVGRPRAPRPRTPATMARPWEARRKTLGLPRPTRRDVATIAVDALP